MANDANKKHYFSMVNDRAKITELLTAMAKQLIEVVLWKQGQEPEEAEKFQVANYSDASKILTIKGKSLLTKFMASTLCNEETVLVKGTLDKLQYFGSGKLEFDKNTTDHHFQLTGSLFVSQQRTNYRLQANRNVRIQFKIDNEVFDGLDISAGGTSFISRPEDQERFAKGKFFENCTLRVNRVDFTIPQVKVAGNWPVKDDEDNVTGFGLGIQFINLPAQLDEDLCRHINSEARAEEIRKSLEEEKLRKK